MAEQTLGDRDERLAANFDGTEFTECFPTSEGVSFRSKLGTAASRDLLGTVSQSGGVPTGAIIERDSNSNGEYVKFADGTLIETGFLTAELSVGLSAAGESVISDIFVGTNTPTGGTWPGASAYVEGRAAGGGGARYSVVITGRYSEDIRVTMVGAPLTASSVTSTCGAIQVSLTKISTWY